MSWAAREKPLLIEQDRDDPAQRLLQLRTRHPHAILRAQARACAQLIAGDSDVARVQHSEGVELGLGQERIQRGPATGGCAFLSKALGCNVLTGDGGLLAAEVGAEMSGMEFSNAYAIAPAHASVTKTAFYSWAAFYYADGRVIEGAGSQRGRSVIARTLLTQPVYACLDRIPEEYRPCLRELQPNFFLPFDRAGIDPCTDKFEVTLRLEGTVRGTGGIRLHRSRKTVCAVRR